ncbi:FAD:protein FMN transferase [Pseudarthrobacter sulfonivorans]|uniref:FAD:protein FMN transferase n=1 Tax=Pseudarthrobacter sulfonivorans TaxID=121292 RepID=UPI0021054EC6|nr:FAD:protein FMN transferase [Pseudarthrobacter sulfonivorans]
MEAQSRWPVWGLDACLTVTHQWMLAEAEEVVRAVVAGVDLACSRFRSDSELMRLGPVMADGVTVSATFRHLMERALFAARLTAGDVDPTLGADLDALGYRQGIASVPVPIHHPGVPAVPPAHLTENRPAAPRVPGWTRIRLDGSTLTVPADLRLDLGATAKAVAADLAAAQVHARLGCGVLVSLGGDLATAGSGPFVAGQPGAWQVLVQDLPADPGERIALEPGFALATSSTQKRRWKHAGTDVHHILDPRFGLPADPVWRSVTVAARTCLEANAYSTAAIVRGSAALDWFRSAGIPGRFVDQRGRTMSTGGWPDERRRVQAGASRG